MMAPQLAAAMKQNGMGLPSSDTPQHGGNAFEMLTARQAAQQQAAQASTMQMGGAPMPMGHMAPLQHMQHLQQQQQQQHAFAAGGMPYGAAPLPGRPLGDASVAPPPRAAEGAARSLRAPSAAKCSRRRPT